MQFQFLTGIRDTSTYSVRYGVRHGIEKFQFLTGIRDTSTHGIEKEKVMGMTGFNSLQELELLQP